jgi:polyribonucleotide nucleotidyltransferase
MTKEFKFDIASRVHITELGLRGTIVSISITQTGTQYETRYFREGEHKFAFLYEWELEGKTVERGNPSFEQQRAAITTGK